MGEPTATPASMLTSQQTVTLGADEVLIDSASLELTIVPPGKHGVHAEELSKLSAFSQLTHLVLREDAMEKGIPLATLAVAPTLTELHLAYHKGPLEGLENITQLRKLTLLDCTGFSLPPLELEILCLSRCQEVDWPSLGRLSSLDLLSLEHNLPQDMSFLTSISGLKSLQIQVHFDLVPDPNELGPLPVILSQGDDIPGWIPGDREAMSAFLEQPDRQIVIHLSAFTTFDCNFCAQK